MRAIAATSARASLLGTAAIATVPVAYLVALSVTGLLGGRRRVALPADPHTKFAIMVPAHNEGAGLAATLASFEALDYPTGLFSVHVVADNCTDDTAAVVRASPWHVHERHAPDDPGKGPALNWLYNRLSQEGDFDAVLVVDADTTLHRSFLRAMDATLRAGAAVAQGHYSVRDPDASRTSSFRFAALACRHHLRPLGRNRIGASCGLYGNGMAFRRWVLDTHRWSGHLVEDAELQNELLLQGHLVEFVPDALLWAEMPDSPRHATSQNERWERGRIDVARRYVPRLLAGIAREPRRRVAYTDAMLDHLTPPLSALATLHLAIAGTAAVGRAVGGRSWRHPLLLSATALAGIGGHAFAGLASVRAPSSQYRALLTAPPHVLWKSLLWLRVLVDPTDREWVRTTRNREAM